MSEPLIGKKECSGEVTSAWGLASNLITSGLGIGVLSLPWSAAGASLIPGVVVTGLVLAVMAWTSCLIVEAGERYQTFDLGALLRLLPAPLGSYLEWICNAVIWIGGLMCLMGYLIVVADSVQPFLAGSALDSKTGLILVTAVLCLLLCSLDQAFLTYSSSIAIAMNVYLFAFVAFLAWKSSSKSGDTEVCKFGVGRGLISMSSTLCMAIAVQMFCLPLYETMELRSVPRFRTIAWSSFGFMFVLFAGFQVVALSAFGPQVLQDILQELPKTLLGDSARLGMVPVMLASYPLNVIPLVAPIQHASWGGRRVAAGATVGITVVVAAAALFFTELGVLNAINGAVTVIMIDTVGPGLIGLYLLERNRWAMLSLCMAGGAMMVAGLLYTSNYAEDMEASCFWH